MKNSSHDKMHPYLKGLVFWGKPENQFWEREGYSQWGKEYHRANLKDMQKHEISLTKVDGSITQNKNHY